MMPVSFINELITINTKRITNEYKNRKTNSVSYFVRIILDINIIKGKCIKFTTDGTPTEDITREKRVINIVNKIIKTTFISIY